MTGPSLFSLIAVLLVGSNFQQLWQLYHTIAYILNKLQFFEWEDPDSMANESVVNVYFFGADNSLHPLLLDDPLYYD